MNPCRVVGIFDPACAARRCRKNHTLGYGAIGADEFDGIAAIIETSGSERDVPDRSIDGYAFIYGCESEDGRSGIAQAPVFGLCDRRARRNLQFNPLVAGFRGGGYCLQMQIERS